MGRHRLTLSTSYANRNTAPYNGTLKHISPVFRPRRSLNDKYDRLLGLSRARQANTAAAAKENRDDSRDKELFEKLGIAEPNVTQAPPPAHKFNGTIENGPFHSKRKVETPVPQWLVDIMYPSKQESSLLPPHDVIDTYDHTFDQRSGLVTQRATNHSHSGLLGVPMPQLTYHVDPSIGQTPITTQAMQNLSISPEGSQPVLHSRSRSSTVLANTEAQSMSTAIPRVGSPISYSEMVGARKSPQNRSDVTHLTPTTYPSSDHFIPHSQAPYDQSQRQPYVEYSYQLYPTLPHYLPQLAARPRSILRGSRTHKMQQKQGHARTIHVPDEGNRPLGFYDGTSYPLVPSSQVPFQEVDESQSFHKVQPGVRFLSSPQCSSSASSGSPIPHKRARGIGKLGEFETRRYQPPGPSHVPDATYRSVESDSVMNFIDENIPARNRLRYERPRKPARLGLNDRYMSKDDRQPESKRHQRPKATRRHNKARFYKYIDDEASENSEDGDDEDEDPNGEYAEDCITDSADLSDCSSENERFDCPESPEASDTCTVSIDGSSQIVVDENPDAPTTYLTHGYGQTKTVRSHTRSGPIPIAHQPTDNTTTYTSSPMVVDIPMEQMADLSPLTPVQRLFRHKEGAWLSIAKVQPTIQRGLHPGGFLLEPDICMGSQIQDAMLAKNTSSSVAIPINASQKALHTSLSCKRALGEAKLPRVVSEDAGTEMVDDIESIAEFSDDMDLLDGTIERSSYDDGENDCAQASHTGNGTYHNAANKSEAAMMTRPVRGRLSPVFEENEEDELESESDAQKGGGNNLQLLGSQQHEPRQYYIPSPSFFNDGGELGFTIWRDGY